MQVPIQLTVFMLTLGWLVASAAAVPLPARGAPITGSAQTATPDATDNAPTALTPDRASRPYGITTVNDFEPDPQGNDPLDGKLFQDQTYTNANIAGLTFRTSWGTVEPSEGSFVWTKLDTVFDKAEQNGKWVELILIPGFGTPAWARQGVQTASLTTVYGLRKGETLDLPLPWDQTYLDRWFTFL